MKWTKGSDCIPSIPSSADYATLCLVRDKRIKEDQDPRLKALIRAKLVKLDIDSPPDLTDNRCVISYSLTPAGEDAISAYECVQQANQERARKEEEDRAERKHEQKRSALHAVILAAFEIFLVFLSAILERTTGWLDWFSWLMPK